MDFEVALGFILRWEGGFVNNPADAGGATNHGITQRTYDAYRDRKGLARNTVRYIAPGEVREIYQTEYWDIWKSWGVSGDLQAAVFDTCINLGVTRTGRWLKLVGKDTKAFLRLRLQAYVRFATVPSQKQFLEGWENRLNELCRTLNIRLQSGLVDTKQHPWL